MSKVLRCPKCSSDTFEGNVYCYQNQAFNKHGDWIDDNGDFEYSNGPNEYSCAVCGAYAEWIHDSDEDEPEPLTSTVADDEKIIITLDDIPSNYEEAEGQTLTGGSTP